ncbi:AAA family ATPase [Cyanobacterium aponinum]|uniref:AAA family ATPase n=1 Tax=Cyanobacterium aponinum TaxID=379064 RepID=UPI000C12D3E8|nr:ATP-binding protein [Cyanobacterium aponinum]PHV61600.1 AAA family ATPase [Cyanobacterium aponinum IPPAS B-1201]
MQLTFDKKHKSIDGFPNTQLPNFTVITGLNGSGKTHLLEALQNGAIKIDEIDSKNDEIRLFDWFTLVPNDDGKFDLAEKRKEYWNKLLSAINTVKQQYKNNIENLESQVNQNIGKLDLFQVAMIADDDLTEKFGNSPQQINIYNHIKQTIRTIENQIINKFSNNGQQKEKKLFLDVLKSKLDSPIINLTEDTFLELYLSISTPVNAFQQSFGQLFVSYMEKWNINVINKDRQQRGEDIDYMSDEEFYDKNGKPPWDFVNQILQQNHLEFRIDKPEKYHEIYEPKLIHQKTKEKIKFDSLSSGEKILISFAFCLYYTADKRQTVNYPKVLLFDEIDAPLHPSMTLSVLNTIQKILVKEQNIKVIMTTHSPSTVALSPEESIYVMEKETRHLNKTTKDKALSLLTSGVPTLSINHENRRQVFVESKYDVKCYEKIYNKLKNKLIPEISLTFINIGVQGENCQQVKEIVNKLVDDKKIYGIIDWDSQNKSNGNIQVLGENKRYTIENYIFDPVLVGIFLLREKCLTFEELGLNKHKSYFDIKNFTDSDFQLIVDFIISRLSNNLTDESLNKNLIECEYLNGCKLKIVKWFLEKKGHDLYPLLTQTFQQLNKYRENGKPEEILKEKILNTVFDDYPELISVDFLYLFKNIQNYQY